MPITSIGGIYEHRTHMFETRIQPERMWVVADEARYRYYLVRIKKINSRTR